MDAAKSAVTIARQKIAEQAKWIGDLKCRLTKNQSMNIEYKKWIDDLKGQLAAGDAQNNRQAQTIHQIDRINSELEAEVTRLTNRLRDVDAEIHELKRQLTHKDGHIAELSQVIDRLEVIPYGEASRNAVTAQDWEPKTIGPIHPNDVLQVPIVTPGPIEDYRLWTMDDVQAGTVLKWVKSAVTVLVTHVGPSDVNIMGRPVDYNGILRSGWRQLNGDRCGVRKEAV